jgi:hypothetical protein
MLDQNNIDKLKQMVQCGHEKELAARRQPTYHPVEEKTQMLKRMKIQQFIKDNRRAARIMKAMNHEIHIS